MSESKSFPGTITFTRKEAERLFTEIASVAEAAYRRGVQQAVAGSDGMGSLRQRRWAVLDFRGFCEKTTLTNLK